MGRRFVKAKRSYGAHSNDDAVPEATSQLQPDGKIPEVGINPSVDTPRAGTVMSQSLRRLRAAVEIDYRLVAVSGAKGLALNMVPLRLWVWGYDNIS